LVGEREDAQSALSREEPDALMTAITDSACGCARQRAGLEVEQRHLAVRLASGDLDAARRWSGLQTKLGELEQADHVHGQLRAEVSRLHSAWTPEIEARAHARAELERYFDALRVETQNLVGELKTLQVPSAAKEKRVED